MIKTIKIPYQSKSFDRKIEDLAEIEAEFVKIF